MNGGTGITLSFRWKSIEQAIREACNKVKTKTTIDFTKDVRGK